MFQFSDGLPRYVLVLFPSHPLVSLVLCLSSAAQADPRTLLWTPLIRCGSAMSPILLFFADAAWVRSRAERPSVSYTKVTSKVAWTGHNLQFTKTNSNNKLQQQQIQDKKRGGREDETDARAVRSDPLARRIE